MSVPHSSDLVIPGLDSSVMSAPSEQLAVRTAIARYMMGARTRDVRIISASTVTTRKLHEHSYVNNSDSGSKMIRTDMMSRYY